MLTLHVDPSLLLCSKIKYNRIRKSWDFVFFTLWTTLFQKIPRLTSLIVFIKYDLIRFNFRGKCYSVIVVRIVKNKFTSVSILIKFHLNQLTPCDNSEFKSVSLKYCLWVNIIRDMFFWEFIKVIFKYTIFKRSL